MPVSHDPFGPAGQGADDFDELLGDEFGAPSPAPPRSAPPRSAPTGPPGKDAGASWERLSGQWKRLRGDVYKRWGKLTQDDLDRIEGGSDQLAGKIQERYGVEKEEARRQIEDWARRPEADGKRPYDVFISYTSNDRQAAEALAAAVREAWPEARLFDYRHEIDQSLFWQREIDAAIENCERIVAVLSPEYFASPECTEEIMIARLRNKRAGGGVLLPVYWRSLPGDLALWLQIINYADCRESDAALLRTFAGKLRARGFEPNAAV